MAGELASELVLGIQSQGVGTSLKHFAANNQETDRMRVDVQVDERTLREIYLPAFEKVVTRAQPWTVMCAYNRVNGTYASQDPWLLTEVLRNEWGFDGLVVSDWGAVDERAPGVAAGLDLEMPSSHGLNDARIVDAVHDGTLAEKDLDAAAERVLRLIARAQPALSEPGNADHEAHHVLARDVAARAAVLLKNDDGTLPLNAEQASSDVALIGELARKPRYQGAGSSLVNPTRLDSVLDAFTDRGLAVGFAPGYRLAEADDGAAAAETRSDEELRAEAVSAATGKTAVLVLGLPAVEESEGYDRTHLDIPASQRELLNQVSSVARKTVVALVNGGVVAVSEWADQADSILELWLGGQAGGSAAADLLLGDAAPSGRLAESIPVHLSDVPAQLNFPGENGVVRYGEGQYIGYRGLDAVGAEVSYPFGHGLTYTTFDYTDLHVRLDKVTEQTAPTDVVARVSLIVTNTGDRTGVAVPQLYAARPESAISRAPRELVGFNRIELDAGTSTSVEFELTRRDVSHWDTVTGKWEVESGALLLEAGASSRDLPASASGYLSAPRVQRPLGPNATIREWLNDPEAGPALIEALGSFGATIGDADSSMAAFLGDMPVYKVPVMGMTDEFSLDDLDALVERFGQS